jgi:DNA-binding FrmR family transcriptional regulator
MESDIRAEVVWRLNTAAGHLHAIYDLIEAGMPYKEVIHQLGAVKAALRAASIRLLTCQIKQSEDIILNGSVEARMAKLTRLHDFYELLLRQHGSETEGQSDDL